MNSKYTLALPLYRQEQELARIGVPVSRQTMPTGSSRRMNAGFLIFSRRFGGSCCLLHTDGHGAYHCKLPPEITVVGCWAHMRRKFTDTLKGLPQELRDRSLAKVGLDYCDKLLHLESGFANQGLSFQKRYQARLERSKPVAEKFFAWAK